MPKKLFSLLLFSLIFLNAFFLTAVVAFQITKSGEMATVPDLAGKTVEDARADLDENKLVLVQTGIALHAHFEKGEIIAQIPAAENKVSLYTQVKVVVSAGKEKVTVPGLRGRALQAVIPLLQESGLRKGSVTHVHSRRFSAGRIISQFPLPEQEVPIQSQINFLVSEGEEEVKYLMPDLLGRRISAARAQLEQLGFRLGPVRRRYYRGYEPGIIIDQNPRQGQIIKKRNTITLEVTR